MNIRQLKAPVLVSAVLLIGGFEGYRAVTYRDAVGVPTVCFGSTELGGKAVVLGRAVAPQECAAALVADTLEAAKVLDCFTVPLTENQQVAVTSWAYNVGVGAACGSTLVRLANAGRPAAEWCRELDRWVYAGGRKLDGLVARRAKEREVCLTESGA